MLKKIFLFIILILISSHTYAIGVEEVFNDIDKNYKYYSELQDLYDKGIIKESDSGYFNPTELLKRDDFAGIVSEVSCNKCIFPNTPSSLVSKYYGANIFFDLTDINPNFYCIANMQDKGFIKGYDKGYTCEDGTMQVGEAPFCANNYVTRQEAIAIMLRSSNIFTIQDNDLVKQKIAMGDITAGLADDVSPINNGVVNTFYGYLNKALDYGFTDKIINSDGEVVEKEYKLLEKDENNNLNPESKLTREDYLKVAYVVFRKNSCNFDLTDNNTISAQIKVLESYCTESMTSCKEADKSKSKYDFDASVEGQCSDGIKNYKRIFNFLGETNSSYNKVINTKYVDNYDFTDNSGNILIGEWKVNLEVIDNCGNSSNVSKTLYIGEKTDFNFSMEANPKSGEATLNTFFSAKVYGNISNVTYNWVFGDGNKAVGRVVQNAYKTPGYYDVTLIIEDVDTGRKVTDNVTIHVLNPSEKENINNISSNNDSDSDIDRDGILDRNDYCVLVYGVVENNGCPIFENKCSSNSDCSKGKMCDTSSGYCVLDTDGDKVPDSEDNCRLTPGLINNAGCPDGAIGENCYVSKEISGVCGSATCNTCPCDNEVDFKADLRKCDLVFPTILSPDGADIYAKGQNKIINN